MAPIEGPSKNPKTWYILNGCSNRLALFVIALAILVTLCGCREGQRTVVSAGKVPTLEVAEKPQLQKLDEEDLNAYKQLPEKTRSKLEQNDKALKSYAEQNAAVIKEYNGFAKLRNSMSDEFLGKGDSK